MAYLGIPQNTIAVLQKYHLIFRKIRTEFSDRYDGLRPDHIFRGDHEGGLCAGDRSGHRHHDTVSGGARGQCCGGGDRQGVTSDPGGDSAGL